MPLAPPIVTLAEAVADSVEGAATRTVSAWPSRMVPGVAVKGPPLIDTSPPLTVTGEATPVPNPVIVSGAEVACDEGAAPNTGGNVNGFGRVSNFCRASGSLAEGLSTGTGANWGIWLVKLPSWVDEFSPHPHAVPSAASASP